MVDVPVALIAGVVDRLFPGLPFEVDPLPGGITNANFRVTVGPHDVVVRVPGKNTEVLGIRRDVEVAANRIAASVGVAPELVALDEETGCVVTRFVDGRSVQTEELSTEPMLGDVVTTLVRVHAAGTVAATFDHFGVIRSYHDEARRRGVREPFDYESAASVLARIESVRPFRPTVLGHNDLLNANFLHDGTMRILDWEYAGMADPYFDLANFCANNELGDDTETPVLAHYFGCVDEARLATLRLMKLVSELREAMWGVVQVAVSELDVDFGAYAEDRAERFRALLGRIDLDRLLDSAAMAGR
jgi:thiamine kinase-like enzyme